VYVQKADFVPSIALLIGRTPHTGFFIEFSDMKQGDTKKKKRRRKK